MIVYFTYMGQELVVIHLVLEEIANLTTWNKVGCISVVISRHDLVYPIERYRLGCVPPGTAMAVGRANLIN